MDMVYDVYDVYEAQNRAPERPRSPGLYKTRFSPHKQVNNLRRALIMDEPSGGEEHREETHTHTNLQQNH